MIRLTSLGMTITLVLLASALRAQNHQGLELLDRSVLIPAETNRDWVGRGRLLDRGDGTWLYLYVHGNHHGLRDTTKKVHLRFSTDEGKSWTKEDTLPDGSAVKGMPVLPPENVELGEVGLVQCPNGDLLALHRRIDAKDRKRLGEGLMRSKDGGRSWQSEGIVMGDTAIKQSLDHCVAGKTILVPFVQGQMRTKAG